MQILKILLINSVFFPTQIGGAEVSVSNLADGLNREGINVTVLSTENGLKNMREDLSTSGVRRIYLPDLNLYWPFEHNRQHSLPLKILQKTLDIKNFRYYNIIKEVLDKIQPDVIHTNNLKGISVVAWSIAKIHGIPIVHTLRDYYLICSKSSMRRGDENCSRQCGTCRLYSFEKKRLSSNVKHVIGISEYILSAHVDSGHFRNSSKSVIYNSAFQADNLPRISPRQKGSHNIRFGYFGRIELDKGIIPMITLLRELRKRLSFELIVGGSGNAELESQLKNCSFVKFLGTTSPDRFFPGIDYLLVPSIWPEPMGRVVIEAYAYGVPVISSNSGGLPELISPGKTGICINFEDIEKSIGSMVEFLAVDLGKLSHDCIAASSSYTNDRMVNSYLNIYKQLNRG